MKNTTKTPQQKNRRPLLLLSVFLFITVGLVVVNASQIKHFLLLRFGTPQTYMAYVESRYLLAQGKEWRENTQIIANSFSQVQYNAVEASLSLNHLIFDLLTQYGVPIKNDFPGAALFFLYEKKGKDTLFQTLGQVGDTPIASLDFLHSAKAQELYISCPQAGSAALSLSTAENDPFTLLLQYLDNLFATLQNFMSGIPSDPFTRLLPYLDAITDVTKETVLLPLPNSTDYVLRLDMRLSLDTLQNIAGTQFAAYDSADLLLRAYVDEKGNILGHEFYLLSGQETLLSLTGLLLPDKMGKKSGDLTLYSHLGKNPITIFLSVSQLGYDTEEGSFTGKINFSCDCLLSINFQLRFTTERSFENNVTLSLPKLILRAHALGVTLLTAEFIPAKIPPRSWPSQNYQKIYPSTEIYSFLKSLDFSGIITKFSDQTGIDLHELAALFHSVFP